MPTPAPLLVFALAAAIAPAQDATPELERLAAQLAGPDAADSRHAEELLVRAGPRAVDVLVALLPHTEVPDDTRPARRAAEVLARIGPDADGALSALVGSMRLVAQRADREPNLAPAKPAVRRFASLGVRPMHPGEAHYELQSALARAHTEIANPAPGDEIATWIAEIGEANPFRKERAARRCAALGPRAAAAAPALRRALRTRHDNFEIRAGLQIIRPIVAIDRHAAVRREVAQALVRVTPDEPESQSAYVALLEHPDPLWRREGVMALGRLAGRARGSRYFLQACLGDDDPRVVREVVTALGMLGPAARKATPALEALLSSDDPQLAARARAALRQIRGR